MLKPLTIITLSLFIAAVALGWFFIIPNVRQIGVLQDGLVQEKEDLAILQQAGAAIEGAQNFYAGLSEKNIKLLSLAAPSAPDKHDLAFQLNRHAAESGVILREIVVADPLAAREGTSGVLFAVPITLQLEGSYTTLKAFLVNVEQSLRIFDVMKISINSIEAEEEGGGTFSFEVSGNAYYAAQ